MAWLARVDRINLTGSGDNALALHVHDGLALTDHADIFPTHQPSSG